MHAPRRLEATRSLCKSYTVDEADFSQGQSGKPTYVLGQHAIQSQSLPVLARQCVSDQHPDEICTSGCLVDVVTDFLANYAQRQLEVFSRETGFSGLEPLLPTDSQSHAVIPFFAGDQPLFLLVASVSRFSHVLQGGDTNFLRSLGHILRAQILQARVVEADAAKTRFMSSISHELRTPMHGVLGNLQLLHDAFESGDIAEAKTLLGHADASGHALQRILNDVLDFGTITQGRLSLAKNTQIDLGSVVLSVARICQAGMHAAKRDNVEIRVQMEERDWTANLDDAGFQRCVIADYLGFGTADKQNPLQRVDKRH
jgi:signal transduction histidine kinase